MMWSMSVSLDARAGASDAYAIAGANMSDDVAAVAPCRKSRRAMPLMADLVTGFFPGKKARADGPVRSATGVCGPGTVRLLQQAVAWVHWWPYSGNKGAGRPAGRQA